MSRPLLLPAVQLGTVAGRQTLCTPVGAKEFTSLLTSSLESQTQNEVPGAGSLGVAELFPHGRVEKNLGKDMGQQRCCRAAQG